MAPLGVQVHYAPRTIASDLCFELVLVLGSILRRRNVFEGKIYGTVPKSILENLGHVLGRGLVSTLFSFYFFKAVLGGLDTCLGYFASCCSNLALEIY